MTRTYLLLVVASLITFAQAFGYINPCERTWELPCTNCRGLPIPDDRHRGSTSGIVDKIFFDASQIPHFCAIEDVDITINIRHTYEQDLELSLTNPGMVSKSLGRLLSCSSHDNIKVILDDDGSFGCRRRSSNGFQRLRPSSAQLSSFNGKDASGLWELDIVDRIGGDVGHINDISISITTTIPNLCHQLTCSRDCNGCGVLEWYLAATVELFARRQIPSDIFRRRTVRDAPSMHRSRRRRSHEVSEFGYTLKQPVEPRKKGSYREFLDSLQWRSGENFPGYIDMNKTDPTRDRRSHDVQCEGSGSGSSSGSGSGNGDNCRNWTGNCDAAERNFGNLYDRGYVNIPPASEYINLARYPENRGAPSFLEGSGSGSGRWNVNGGSGSSGYRSGIGYGSSFDFGYGSGSGGSGNLNLAAEGTGGNVPFDFFMGVLVSIFPEPEFHLCGWDSIGEQCEFINVTGDRTTQAEAEHLYESRPMGCQRYYTSSPTTTPTQSPTTLLSTTEVIIEFFGVSFSDLDSAERDQLFDELQRILFEDLGIAPNDYNVTVEDIEGPPASVRVTFNFDDSAPSIPQADIQAIENKPVTIAFSSSKAIFNGAAIQAASGGNEDDESTLEEPGVIFALVLAGLIVIVLAAVAIKKLMTPSQPSKVDPAAGSGSPTHFHPTGPPSSEVTVSDRGVDNANYESKPEGLSI